MKRFACTTALFVCVVLAVHGDQVARGLSAGIALQPPMPFSRLTESRRADQFSAALGFSAHMHGDAHLGARSTLLGPYSGTTVGLYYYVISDSGHDGPVVGARFDTRILLGWNVRLGEKTFVRVEISPLFYRTFTVDEATGEPEPRNRLGFAATLEPGILCSR